MPITERLAAIQRGDYFIVPGIQRAQDGIITSREQRHQEEFQQNLPADPNAPKAAEIDIVDPPTLSRFYYTSLLVSAKGAVQAGIHRTRRVFFFGKQPYAEWSNRDACTETHREGSYAEFSVGIDAQDTQGHGRETATEISKFRYTGVEEYPDPAHPRLVGCIDLDFYRKYISKVELSWRGTNRPHDLPKIFGQRALFAQAFLDEFGFNRGLPTDENGVSSVTFHLLPVLPIRIEVDKYPVVEFDYMYTDRSRGFTDTIQLASHFGRNDGLFQPIEPLGNNYQDYTNKRDYGNSNIRKGAIDFKEITDVGFLKFLEYVLEIIPG